MAGALSEQQPVITPDTSVDSGTLHQWLHSGDPRLISWAADFARRRHDAKIIAEMPALLEHWAIPAMMDKESQSSQRRAVTAVLDTLIQENVQVSIPAIETVAESFPAQAVILIGRLPLDASRTTLNDWTYEATGPWGGRTLARIAFMMLAKDPKPEIVGRVVAESEEELQVFAGSGDAGESVVALGACGDYVGRDVSSGWPQIYTYVLVENDPQTKTLSVIDLDGDRIASRRFEENRGWGSCYGVAWLNSATRHRLIAYWLGVHEKDMLWQPVERAAIRWTNQAAYEQQLGALVEAQRKKLQATVTSLQQRGLLREGQAVTLTGGNIVPAVPRLIVHVQCDIEPCPLTNSNYR